MSLGACSTPLTRLTSQATGVAAAVSTRFRGSIGDLAATSCLFLGRNAREGRRAFLRACVLAVLFFLSSVCETGPPVVLESSPLLWGLFLDPQIGGPRARAF